MSLRRAEQNGERRAAISGTDGRTVLETVLILLMLCILLSVAVERFISSVVPVKETALRMEIANLRSAVSYYAMRNRRLPPDIKTLLKENIKVKSPVVDGEEYSVIVLGKYVESMTTDEEGYPLDPFGGRYVYDPSNGAINSTTTGYTNW